jgi:hypothetical protein
MKFKHEPVSLERIALKRMKNPTRKALVGRYLTKFLRPNMCDWYKDFMVNKIRSLIFDRSGPETLAVTKSMIEAGTIR